ncbi:MAG: hypothetical protein KDA84_28905 [Planctomycetaceae bacterium]|nr:hypothetical protein [Planctomycetaceae bacterium]
MPSTPETEVFTTDVSSPQLFRVWGVVFASLLLFSAIRSPAPGVNEPHYLCKAKHYWNTEWCPDDFFLTSSNPHLVFYVTVGSLTNLLTLEETTWIGRLAGLALLAWGWVRCIGRVVPGVWTSVWVMWMYLATAAVGNWSGEWMVGGVEGKVFAYGFGFWAIAAWWDQQLKRSALWGGLAVSFHPVVGGWIVISAVGAILASALFKPRSENIRKEASRSVSLFNWGLGLVIFVLACLPGIWPAIQLLDSADVRQANIVTWIQVFYRLQHHLDPMTFSHTSYATYGLLVVLWLVARFRLNWGSSERWFAWFVGGSIVIALVGVGLGYGERPIESIDDITWQYRLLKFYPFRLADVMVPIAVCVTVAGLVRQRLDESPLRNWLGSRAQAGVRCWLLFASVFIYSLVVPAVDRNPSRMDDDQLRDWLETCEWIRKETPSDTIVWTPKNSWAFKWYAQRGEYVSRKDCPQDAAGIIEWNERMGHKLHEAFQREPKLGYAIFRKGKGFLPTGLIYENEFYEIYDLSGYARD